MRIWILQGATRQNSFLRMIECDGAKLLPIRYQRWFGNDLVQSDVTLCSG
jgi:hypothetical protein